MPPPDRIPRELQKGDRLSHTYPNSWGDFLRALGVTLGRNLRMHPSSVGIALEADLSACRPDYIRITSEYDAGAGGYAWQEVVRAAGAWVNTSRSATAAADPAKEANGNALVMPSVVVEARRHASGELIFQLDPCVGTTPPPTTESTTYFSCDHYSPDYFPTDYMGIGPCEGSEPTEDATYFPDDHFSEDYFPPDYH
jgi:hypothetical protein